MDYTGTLLIASPHLDDPNFRMTVILLAHQAKEQVMGLVLNRASPHTVGNFWISVFSRPCQSSAPLFIGGPMIGPVLGLKLWRSSDSIYPTETTLSLLVNKEEIKKMAEENEGVSRIFLGHAGWTTNQLAEEIQEGYWRLLPSDEIDLFSDPTDLWLRALERSMRTSLQCLTGLSDLPNDPNCN